MILKNNSRISAILAIASIVLLASCDSDKPNINQQISSTTSLQNDVVLLDESAIQSSSIDDAGDLNLVVIADKYQSLVTGTVVSYNSEDDARFPIEFSGRILNTQDNGDGTSTLIIGPIEYAEFSTGSTHDIRIALDNSNFVGVITPDGIEPLNPIDEIGQAAPTDKYANGSLVFRDAIKVRETATPRTVLNYESQTKLDFGFKVNLSGMGDGVEATTFRPVSVGTTAGLEIRGSIVDLAIHFTDKTNGATLESLDMAVSGELEADVSLFGSGNIRFGHFSQAWREVDSESFKVLGISGKMLGLSSKDKVGQFPVAGLVFSLKCLKQTLKTCPILPGQTQTPIRNAKVGGVIIWLYATLEGELKSEGRLSIVKLNPSKLIYGFSKLNNHLDSTAKCNSTHRVMKVSYDSHGTTFILGGIEKHTWLFIRSSPVSNDTRYTHC